MTLTRKLYYLEKQVVEMIQGEMKRYDDAQLLRLAEHMFGTDNQILISYRKEIDIEFNSGAPLNSDPIVFMGKEVK